jgi:hypothetical protein
MASEAIARQAVVIGAGIAGLAAAGALSDHFEQVVVLERDSLSDGPVHRPGTPQSRHAHGLLVGGQRALSSLFPGFERDLVEAGAVPVGYATAVFHIPSDAPSDWKSVFTIGGLSPTSARGARKTLSRKPWRAILPSSLAFFTAASGPSGPPVSSGRSVARFGQDLF